MTCARTALRILFLVSAHNSLSQRAYIALTELGHPVCVAVVDSAAGMEAAVMRHRPQLIACPMLKTIIPESIWTKHRCLIVHPGPMGDRGASSLDWAIELGMDEWGVTVLEANGAVDGGDVWATRTFATRGAGKSSLYRHEVRRAAIEALVEAVGKVLDGVAPERLDHRDPRVTGRLRPSMSQDVRAIDWSADSTDTVLRRIRAAEGHPGVLDELKGTTFHLFGAHREPVLRGAAGKIIAQRHGAICRATIDGAVWISHLKRRDPRQRTSFKLPATRALALAGLEVDAPEIPVPLHAPLPAEHDCREIVETDSRLVISALAGDAAAGGVPFALAADYVVAREDVVLNPYYRHTGGLDGSEYWTYLLPRRIGAAMTARLTGAPFTPVGRCFLGPDRSYHEARRRFTHKLGAADGTSRTDGNPGWAAARPSTDAVAERVG